MAAFEANRASALTLQEEGDAATRLSQSKYNQATELCGIAEGQTVQTKNTAYWYTTQSRDVLLLKHKGAEEMLEEYGFSVVISQTGARKNVRVDVPTKNPADLIELGEGIIGQHTTLGAGSPLTGNVDMALFGTSVSTASTLMNEWEAARNLAQSKHNQALNLIGYGEGQTSQTAGTLYYDLITVRDRLLQFYSGSEEQLSEWGFDVVISSARPGKDSGGTVIFGTEGDVPAGAVVNITLSGIDDNEIDTLTFQATGSALRYYAAATATDPPGAVFLAVAAGGAVTLTVIQAHAQLGFDDDKELLNVQNPGTMMGHFKLSIRTL